MVVGDDRAVKNHRRQCMQPSWQCPYTNGRPEDMRCAAVITALSLGLSASVAAGEAPLALSQRLTCDQFRAVRMGHPPTRAAMEGWVVETTRAADSHAFAPISDATIIVSLELYCADLPGHSLQTAAFISGMKLLARQEAKKR